MIKAGNRKAVNYSENLIDPRLDFETSQNWTISSGTGTSQTSGLYAFNGVKSLQLDNTSPASSLLATNPNQATTIVRDGVYGFSCYILKSQALEVITGKVNIFKNAVLLSAEPFSIGSATASDDQNEVWVRYITSPNFSLLENDVLTFTFEIDGSGTAAGNILTYFDGMSVYAMDKDELGPPLYVIPKEDCCTHSIKYTLTETELDAGTDIVIVNSAGVGKAIVVTEVNARLTHGGVDYDAGNIGIKNDGATSDQFTISTNIIDATGDKFNTIPNPSLQTTSNIVEDADLIFEFASASTVGDGVLDVYITYQILTI